MKKYRIAALCAFNFGQDLAVDGKEFEAANDTKALAELRKYIDSAKKLARQSGGLQLPEGATLYCGAREVKTMWL